MHKSAIEAEISAQSKLMESIPIDQVLVSEIDRQVKNIEIQLNQRLVHIPARVIVQNFLPEVDGRATLPSVVPEEIWDSFMFGKNWFAQKAVHEEISFDRHAKGFGFFYTAGEVTFDLGVVDYEGLDWYVRVIEDKRQTHKLTGASVEIKLKAFPHVTKLLAHINDQAHQISSNLSADLTRDAWERFPGMQVMSGWNHFFSNDPLAPEK